MITHGVGSAIPLLLIWIWVLQCRNGTPCSAICGSSDSQKYCRVSSSGTVCASELENFSYDPVDFCISGARTCGRTTTVLRRLLQRSLPHCRQLEDSFDVQLLGVIERRECGAHRQRCIRWEQELWVDAKVGVDLDLVNWP